MDISSLRDYYTGHRPTLMGQRGGSAVGNGKAGEDSCRETSFSIARNVAAVYHVEAASCFP